MNLPYDLELETLVIGTGLVNGTLSPESLGVPPLDFYLEANQRIWAVMLDTVSDGRPIEVFDLKAKLNDPAITVSGLSGMYAGLPYLTKASASEIERLRDLATLRRMMRVFNNLTDQAAKKLPILDIVTEAQMFLDTVTDQQDARQGTSQTLIEVMEQEVFPRIDKYVSGEMVKIPFGFESLDTATNGGAALGELVVFGSNPKSGKSVMLLQVARNIAERNVPVLVASLEMMNYENGFRLLAQSSRHSINVFRPNMPTFAADELKAHGREQYALPLHFNQKARTLKEIGQEVARLKDATGLSALVIDYAQLIKSDKRSLGRVERIEEAMVDMKELAMKYEIVVYTAAQFNREGIKSDRPTLAHFDGSSAIEKTANLGLLWTLEKEYDPSVEGRRGEMWIEMGRSVGTDEFNIVFHGKDARFTIQ